MSTNTQTAAAELARATGVVLTATRKGLMGTFALADQSGRPYGAVRRCHSDTGEIIPLASFEEAIAEGPDGIRELALLAAQEAVAEALYLQERGPQS